jgi:hypothetical protein
MARGPAIEQPQREEPTADHSGENGGGGQIGEPGVPTVGQLGRDAGAGIGAPAGLATTDLVDAQRPGRGGWLRAGSNPMGGGDLGDVATLLGDRGSQGLPQPGGDPSPVRHRVPVFSEGVPGTRRCVAGQDHRRFVHTTVSMRSPKATLRVVVAAQSFTPPDRLPHSGHAASLPLVTTYTVRPPSASTSTSTTRKPGRPSRVVTISLSMRPRSFHDSGFLDQNHDHGSRGRLRAPTRRRRIEHQLRTATDGGNAR